MAGCHLLCLFCVSQVLVFNSLVAISSPVVYLEKNNRGNTAASAIVGKQWADCGDPADPLNISDVTVAPMPPKRGSQVVISANITLGENVTNGTFNFQLKYGRFIVWTNSSKLCDAVKFTGEHCPMRKGVHVLGIGFVVPQNAFKGHYTGMVTAADQNDKQLLCLSLDFQI